MQLSRLLSWLVKFVPSGLHFEVRNWHEPILFLGWLKCFLGTSNLYPKCRCFGWLPSWHCGNLSLHTEPNSALRSWGLRFERLGVWREYLQFIWSLPSLPWKFLPSDCSSTMPEFDVPWSPWSPKHHRTASYSERLHGFWKVSLKCIATVGDLYHSGVVFALYTIGFLGVEWAHWKKALTDDDRCQTVGSSPAYTLVVWKGAYIGPPE